MIGIILTLVILIFILAGSLEYLDFRQAKKEREYRRQADERRRREWEALTPEQQREKWLASFLISPNWLPLVRLDTSGEPYLPNFYIGEGWLTLKSQGFSEAEIALAKTFAEARELITTA